MTYLAFSLAAVEPATVAVVAIVGGTLAALGTLIASIVNGARSAFANEMKTLNDVLRADIAMKDKIIEALRIAYDECMSTRKQE